MFDDRGAISLLDISEDKLVELVDVGKLPWSFNIALPGAKRVCFRILPECMEAYLYKGDGTISEAMAMRQLTPHDGPEFKSGLVCRVLNCSYLHLQHLVKTRQLQSRRTEAAGGSYSIVISADSFREFLTRRIIF